MLLSYNIRFKSIHIVENVVADAVSRFQETPILLRNHGMQVQPTSIPEEVHPMSLIPP